ncbi:MAG: hypothetical protein OXE98_00965 [Hyphomicrobiales bacterium]|nr:hypothetical protein [Hyphomicrobiales bacterium]
MKRIIVCSLAVLFTALTALSLSNWEYEKKVDDFDGDVTYEVTFSGHSDGGDFAVWISCKEDNPNDRDVNFIIADVIDSSSEDRIRIKFDSEKPEWFGVKYIDGAKADILYTSTKRDFKKLTGKMKAYLTMEAEINIFRQGRQILPIDLRGFTQEFNKLPSHCQ